MKLSKQKIISLLIIILGNIFLSLGVGVFILPHNIVNGGTSGVSIIIESLFGVDPELIIFVLCWFFFFLGLFVLGKVFALKTLLSTVLFPSLVWVFTNMKFFIGLSNQVSTPILASLTGAFFAGLGMGLVYRAGGSTGGFDVVNLILKKYFKIKVSVSTFVMDTIIILLGFVSLSLENILYGVLCVIVTSYVIERITISGTISYMAHIVSDKFVDINQYLNNVLERGTTLLVAEGGLTGNEKKVIEVVFNKKEYYDIKKNIYLIDKNAFISIYRTINTYGNGFEDFSVRGSKNE